MHLFRQFGSSVRLRHCFKHNGRLRKMEQKGTLTRRELDQLAKVTDDLVTKSRQGHREQHDGCIALGEAAAEARCIFFNFKHNSNASIALRIRSHQIPALLGLGHVCISKQ